MRGTTSQYGGITGGREGQSVPFQGKNDQQRENVCLWIYLCHIAALLDFTQPYLKIYFTLKYIYCLKRCSK